MTIRLNTTIDLRLSKKNFSIPSFWVYRVFRLLLLPLGKNLSLKIGVRLHWIFRHLAIALASNASGYDFLNSRSAIYQSNFLKTHIEKGGRVVDLACGTARFLPSIQEIDGVDYLGIDSSRKHILRNLASFPNANFLLGDCLDFSIIPKCDVIIASHFIEHLENPLRFLVNLRQLCPKIIIEVPDFYSDPMNLVSHSVSGPWWTDRDHKTEYSEELISDLLAEANYRIVDKFFSGGTIAVVATVG
jgi:SAM-dependent methyltransferase